MRKWLGFVGTIAAMCASGTAWATDEAAIRFGARDNVLGVSIAPDGKSLAIVQPNGARGSMVSIAHTDGSGAVKAILSTDGKPNRLSSCRWSTSDRLVCTIW